VTSRCGARIEPRLREALAAVARFYDGRKVGDVGSQGFRRSTDLTKLCACLDAMTDRSWIVPGESRFLDLGCADGRVNVLFGYLTGLSVGIEIHDWILDEYGSLRKELEQDLTGKDLPLPPGRIFLFHGDSMNGDLHRAIKSRTGAGLEEFDLFYTYLTMQEEFAEMIARNARPGALFMIYGLDRILPRFKGLTLLTPERAMEGVLAVYRKEDHLVMKS
jgi:hypothetical protein